MKEFALLFRMDITTKKAQPSKAQMNSYMTSWMKWINSISEQGQLAEGGNHFNKVGKVLRPGGVITDGPYTAHMESVAGYIIIVAEDIKGAVKIAGKCPILEGKETSVELREIASPGE